MNSQVGHQRENIYNILPLSDKKENTLSAQYSSDFAYQDKHPTEGEGVHPDKKNKLNTGTFECSHFSDVSVKRGGIIMDLEG